MRRLVGMLLCLCLPLGLLALSSDLEQQAERMRSHYGKRAEARFRAWHALLDESQQASERDKLEKVNNFFNQLLFLNDIDVWGQKDYWATPHEFLGANAGDCDDFAIAKYFSLRELGVADEKMRLIYVNAVKYQQFHMVLAYYATPSAEPLILDNIDKSIKGATARDDLIPIYSFNAQHLWLMKEKGAGQLAGNASRLKLWNELRTRWQDNALRKPVANFEL